MSVAQSEGSVRRTVFRKPPIRMGTVNWFQYQWIEGDRIDAVAARTIGDPLLWWWIMDANPEIVDPMSIAPGTLIRVPRND